MLFLQNPYIRIQKITQKFCYNLTNRENQKEFPLLQICRRGGSEILCYREIAIFA